MEEYLSFRKMITPVIIKVLFWVGVAGSVIAGLVTIAGSFSYRGVGVLAGFFGGLLIMVLGTVIWRVYCELLMLFFRMNETLTEIRDNLAK